MPQHIASRIVQVLYESFFADICISQTTWQEIPHRRASHRNRRPARCTRRPVQHNSFVTSRIQHNHQS